MCRVHVPTIAVVVDVVVVVVVQGKGIICPFPFPVSTPTTQFRDHTGTSRYLDRALPWIGKH